MHNIAMGGQAEALANSVDLSDWRILFDVGGDLGNYALTLCKHYLDLRAIVFDLLERAFIARKTIASFGQPVIKSPGWRPELSHH